MEACFLTSGSFSRTKDLVAPIKGRAFYCPRRDRVLIRRKTSAFPSSITCCQFDSWTPPDDSNNNNKISAVDSDWRTFRARLVAGEIAIGNRWAHRIQEPEKGCLLVATEKLDGVHIFERTVILLLSVGPRGPVVGVILNRPSLMSIKETKSTVIDAAGTFLNARLFFGGPLEEEGLFLVNPRGKSNDDDDEVGKSGVFRKVIKGMYYGTRESVGLGAEMVKRGWIETSEFRFFDGCCVWEMEALRDEILDGYWTMAASSSSVLELGTCVNGHGLWDEIHGLIANKHVL